MADLMLIIVGIAAVYLTFSFILPLFIVPNLLFKTKTQRSDKLRKFALRFKDRSKEKTLKNIYNYLQRTYTREKINVVLRFYNLFEHDVEKLIDKRGFLHCHAQNLILINLAVNSGQFQERDFERKEVINQYGFLHQYVVANLNGEKIKIDPFAKIFERKAI